MSDLKPAVVLGSEVNTDFLCQQSAPAVRILYYLDHDPDDHDPDDHDHDPEGDQKNDNDERNDNDGNDGKDDNDDKDDG